MEDINLEKLNKLKNNLPYFARNFLKIKSKNDGLINFNMTNIQYHAYQQIEKRKNEGKPCKIVFLKSRQVGMSTLTEARFFHNTLFRKAKNAFVLADKTDSAKNIFSMTKRYYDNLPDGLKIPLLKDSSEELLFKTDSSFRVGTAGSRSVGRSMTINYFHGSEVAFWQNANDIVSGMLQTIPENPESEIILESTANGTSGDGAYFYNLVQMGLDKNSEYLTLFYPWYMQNEYQKLAPVDMKLDEEEEELKRIYNLSNNQLMWRRTKLRGEFNKREYLFKQEYPSSIQEAFITTSNALIPINYIERARNNFINNSDMPIVIGVDPARTSDRTIITIRQGRVIRQFYKFEKMDNCRLAGILQRLIQAVKPAKVFIDYGHGTGTYDILVSYGLSSIVELVQFGSNAYDNKKYSNRRAEMFDKMRDWFMQDGGVFVQHQEYIEEFVRDISILPDLKVSDSTGRFSMEKKEKIIKGTEINSTDFADSLALTFASPVANFSRDFEDFSNQNQIKVTNNNWQVRV